MVETVTKLGYVALVSTAGTTVSLGATFTATSDATGDYTPNIQGWKQEGITRRLIYVNYFKTPSTMLLTPAEDDTNINWSVTGTVSVAALPVSTTRAYGKSTYAELIDVLLSDISNPDVRKLPPATMMDWILRAEERICRLTTVREEYTLRYLAGVADYGLYTRPIISAMTGNAVSPIVVTSTAHGIPNNVRVHIVGSQGNDAANGSWFTSDVAANTVTLNPGAYISNVEIDASGKATVTTETAHGFVDGATVTIAGINTIVPDGSYVIKLLTATTFELVGTLSAAIYESGGVVYQKTASTGNGAYSGGGRISLDYELPSYFSKILSSHGTYQGELYDGTGYAKEDLDRGRDRSATTWGPPEVGSIYTSGGRKYLRIDPVPSANGDMTIVAEVQIIPSEHYSETESMLIHLPSEYDSMILTWMKARAQERLGDVKLMSFWEDRFKEGVKDHNRNEPAKHIHVNAD